MRIYNFLFFLHRVVVFGAGGVGKSSLVLRFIKGTFRENYIPTIEDTYRQVSGISSAFPWTWSPWGQYIYPEEDYGDKSLPTMALMT